MIQISFLFSGACSIKLDGLVNCESNITTIFCRLFVFYSEQTLASITETIVSTDCKKHLSVTYFNVAVTYNENYSQFVYDYSSVNHESVKFCGKDKELKLLKVFFDPIFRSAIPFRAIL